MTGSLKTWGGVLHDLENHLKIASKEAYDNAFGTQFYFEVLHNNLHEEYERWCGKRGVEPARRSDFRDRLLSHLIAHRPPNTTNITKLCQTMPDGWNVRGNWTSKFMKNQ